MKKLKKCNGMTLLAFTITIVILIALAGVAIYTIKDQKITDYAKNEKEKYDKLQIGYNNFAEKHNDYLNYNPSENESNEGTIQTDSTMIGKYVEYDVPYIDMYTGEEYTKTTGWRYFGKDDDGNNLIVSTGMPAYLSFNYYNKITMTEKPEWWPTDEEVSVPPYSYYQFTGWDIENGGAPNVYLAYALKHKFESIPFYYTKSRGEIDYGGYKCCFTQVGDTRSGEGVTLDFRASGVDVIGVRNISISDMNRIEDIFNLESNSDNGWNALRYLEGSALGLFWLDDVRECLYETYVFADFNPEVYENGNLSGDSLWSYNYPLRIG